jgi:hypothetical protein
MHAVTAAIHFRFDDDLGKIAVIAEIVVMGIGDL